MLRLRFLPRALTRPCEVVARSAQQRAKRDAKRHGEMLVYCQAVDTRAGGLLRGEAWKLLQVPNMIRCGRLAGLLGLHRGQRVRCTRKISAALGIVQEATGTIVGFSFHDNENTDWVENPHHEAWGRGWVLLEYLPKGIHVRLDSPGDAAEPVKYVDEQEADAGVWTFTAEQAQSEKINVDGQTYYFTRTGMPVYSANDGTTASMQGSTRDFVTADMSYDGKHETTKVGKRGTITKFTEEECGDMDVDVDDQARGRYWNHSYVKVSRVRRLENLILLNPPHNFREIMEKGPPKETVTEMRRPLQWLCASVGLPGLLGNCAPRARVHSKACA